MDAVVSTRDGRAEQRGRWTPARAFMAIAAAWHIPLGIAGFVYDQSFPIGSEAARTAESSHIFGIFETNGWHSLAALVLGVVTLYLALYPRHARPAAIAIGIVHIAITASLALWGEETFWLASNTEDQFVHASTAVAGLICGLATRPRAPSEA